MYACFMSLHHWPNPQVPWRSFHNHWIVRLVEHLNGGLLPAGFQARPTEMIVGIEPDVLLLQGADAPENGGDGPMSIMALGEATSTIVLAPPAEWPMVGIYSAYDRRRLVSVIEIVSPGNKDRPEAVRRFAEKALFLLQDGVHMLLIDVISVPKQPMRPSLLNRLGASETVDLEGLWVASYCTLPERVPTPHMQVREWAKPVAVGEVLPMMPLFLRGDREWVLVDLEQTYGETLRNGRYQPL